jgi:hypothetical protein
MIPILLKRANNSVYISDPSGIPVLGQSPYGVHGIRNWSYAAKYQQKYLFSDTITIQIDTQENINDVPSPPFVNPPQLYLCDKYDPNTGDFRLYGASVWNSLTGGSVNLNAAPYYKGAQNIANNNWTNPFDSTVYPLVTSMWAFDLATLGISTVGTYYLLLVNKYKSGASYVAKNYFSEPVYFTNILTNTMNFQSQFLSNKGDNWNMIVSGWYNDYPTNTQPYNPIFNFRCEGFVYDHDLKAVNVGYFQQLWQQSQTFAKQVRFKTLQIGELSTGVPRYILEMVTAQILSDVFWIDNYSYIKDNNSGSPNMSDLWKIRSSNIANPLVYASTSLMERYEAQQAIIPGYAVGSHYFAPDYFDDTYFA